MEERNIVVLALVAVAVLGTFGLISWGLALISGWRRLAASYANDTPFEPSQWRLTQVSIRRWVLVHSNLCLHVGTDRQFLYLRTWPFTMPGFQPLRVPWSDVSMQEMKILFWKFSCLSFREQPDILVQMQKKAAQMTLARAGGTWVDGRPEFSA